MSLRKRYFKKAVVALALFTAGASVVGSGGNTLKAHAGERRGDGVRVASLFPTIGVTALFQGSTGLAVASDQLVERVTYESLGLLEEAAAEEEASEDEYADFAVADVQSNVNVRSGPGTGYDIVGVMYNGAVAHILAVSDEDEEWLHVVSGSVEGYIKSQYFLLGEDAANALDQFTSHYAVVRATRLNVRTEADIDSNRIGYVEAGEKLDVLEDLGDWIKVQYTGEKEGYVSAEYVQLTEEYVYAKSIEEIRAEEAARREKEERERAAMQSSGASENYTITYTPPSGDYSTNAELRQQIVEYALQFVGNRYVNGGQSLSSGTDCSGFTCYIYRDFGYSLSRTPSGQYSSNGRSISLEEAQPGDIICYGSGGCSHVALYIGDGQIVHEANSRKGCIVSGIDFMNIVGVKNVID